MISTMDLNNVFGAFGAESDGVPVAHTMAMFRWRDGKKVILWPDELAPGKPCFPTSPWRQYP